MSTSKTTSSIPWLTKIAFNNTAIKSLPIDPLDLPHTSRQVKKAIFSKSKPCINLVKPKLVSVSLPALKLLHKDAANFSLENYRQDENFTKIFCAEKILTEQGSEPHSHCYCGHQFGVFAGQLGDGTNSYLGEVNGVELQLKGSGKTPYSRGSDGKKVLRSSLREFLCSEHMHALGIPTTRAATVITSFDTLVERHDATRMFLQKSSESEESLSEESDSNNFPSPLKSEPAAVISRIAPTFLRFGSFEVVKSEPCPQSGKASNNPNDAELLQSLCNYTIKNFFSDKIDNENNYQSLLNEVTILTAQLVAKWQAFGFCHGVLNTDNMSILGLTIDYGPFGFMDYFDEDYVCNFSDHNGRYSYANQKDICEWNLTKFEEALNEDLDKEDVCLDRNLYHKSFDDEYLKLMGEKLGLVELPGKDFLDKLFTAMGESRSDFLETFLLLERFRKADDTEASSEEFAKKLANISQKPSSIKSSLVPILSNTQLINIIRMSQRQKIPIEFIVGEFEAKNVKKQFNRIIKMQELSELSEQEKFEKDTKIWQEFLVEYLKLKVDLGKFKNPRILLKNYLAQEVIEKAEGGDFGPVNGLLEKLLDPFSDHDKGGEVCRLVPGWAEKMCVSCSS